MLGACVWTGAEVHLELEHVCGMVCVCDKAPSINIFVIFMCAINDE